MNLDPTDLPPEDSSSSADDLEAHLCEEDQSVCDLLHTATDMFIRSRPPSGSDARARLSEPMGAVLADLDRLATGRITVRALMHTAKIKTERQTAAVHEDRLA